MKKRPSPQTPYRVKAKGKETRTGCFTTDYKNAPARVRQKKRYDDSGDAAYECVHVVHGSFAEHFRFVAKIVYRNFEERGRIIDKAYELASRERQGEIHCALSAFLRWLDRNYPKGFER